MDSPHPVQRQLFIQCRTDHAPSRTYIMHPSIAVGGFLGPGRENFVCPDSLWTVRPIDAVISESPAGPIHSFLPSLLYVVIKVLPCLLASLVVRNPHTWQHTPAWLSCEHHASSEGQQKGPTPDIGTLTSSECSQLLLRRPSSPMVAPASSRLG